MSDDEESNTVTDLYAISRRESNWMTPCDQANVVVDLKYLVD